MTASERVAVVGAGLAGCLLAPASWPAAAHRGRSTSAATTRAGQAPNAAGRSTSRSPPAASTRCGRIGLDERVLADALPMRGRMMHPPTGALAYQSYCADGTARDQLDQPGAG